MKFYVYLLVGALSLSLTSCLDIIEEVYLNADGSGRYLITMDMSGLFSDPMMKDVFAESLKEQTGGGELEIDSSFAFTDLEDMPESLSAADRELIKRVTGKMQFSQSKEKGMIVIELPFKKVEEINRFTELMSQMGKDEEESGIMSGMFGGPGGLTSSKTNYALDGRTFKRTSNADAAALDALADDESMQMMKFLMADATYTSIYHFPGKVRKIEIDDAEAVVENNTVTVEMPFLEMMEKKKLPDVQVKFKKS